MSLPKNKFDRNFSSWAGSFFKNCSSWPSYFLVLISISPGVLDPSAVITHLLALGQVLSKICYKLDEFCIVINVHHVVNPSEKEFLLFRPELLLGLLVILMSECV